MNDSKSQLNSVLDIAISGFKKAFDADETVVSPDYGKNNAIDYQTFSQQHADKGEIKYMQNKLGVKATGIMDKTTYDKAIGGFNEGFKPLDLATAKSKYTPEQVKAFQKHQGLAEDGIYGVKTHAMYAKEEKRHAIQQFNPSKGYAEQKKIQDYKKLHAKHKANSGGGSRAPNLGSINFQYASSRYTGSKVENPYARRVTNIGKYVEPRMHTRVNYVDPHRKKGVLGEI